MDEVEGLSNDVSEGTEDVVLIRCDLCARHEGKLRVLRNFSSSFVKGLRKKDNVVKHGISRKITDWRCRLGESTLDHLIRISVDGPSLLFDPDMAVHRFFT
jgi:hypothetical protein